MSDHRAILTSTSAAFATVVRATPTCWPAAGAAFVVMGADEVVMARNSELMIHEASGVCVGPSDDMRKTADVLDKLSDNVAAIYADRASGSTETWRAAMREETWYSADEAVAAGLADRVEESRSADEPKAMHDLTVFNFAGRSAAPAPVIPEPPSASASGSPEEPSQEGSYGMPFTPEQLTNMRQALGLAEDADGSVIVAALGEALTERADPAPVVPPGHVVIPQAQLADLQQNAELGAQAAERLRVQDREAFLDTVRAKYAPSNRSAWAAEYDRDPEGTRAHFKGAPDIINQVPAGHDGQSDADMSDPYVALFGSEG